MEEFEFFSLYRSSDRGTKGSRGWYAQELDRFKSMPPRWWSAVYRGEVALEEAVTLKIGGGCQTNFVCKGFGFLFDQRTLDCMKGAALTGWSTFPVRLLGKDGKELRAYYGLVIKGRSGPVTNINRVPGEAPRIDPGTWDGSDFFVPGDSDHQFATRRVVELFESQDISGIQWKPLPNA